MMNEIIYDLDHCELSDRNGMYGGQAGSKEGILFHDTYWIVKYPKSTKSMEIDDQSYTIAPLSEYIGSHIYQILGYDVHETILGYRNQKIVVACKDFCKHPGDLREVRTLKNVYNKELEQILDRELHITGSTHSVDLKELLIHLENNPILSKIPGIKERFWECALIDAFIKNNDRNNGNWGLLFENKEYRLAPIYDNGAAFSNKLSENRIQRMMQSPGMLRNHAMNSVTCYSIEEHQLNLSRLIKLDDMDLKKAVVKVVPLIKDKLPEIKHFINNIPDQFKGFDVCSPLRKEFYIKGLEIRERDILIPEYNNIVKDHPKLLKNKKIFCRVR